MKTAILTVVVCAMLLWAGAVLATATPGQICAATKQTAAGQEAKGKLACYAMYAKRGVSFDIATCLTNAETRFSKAFQNAEFTAGGSLRGCAVTGDAAAIEALVDNFVAAVVAALPPPATPTPTSTRTRTPTRTPTPTRTGTPWVHLPSVTPIYATPLPTQTDTPRQTPTWTETTATPTDTPMNVPTPTDTPTINLTGTWISLCLGGFATNYFVQTGTSISGTEPVNWGTYTGTVSGDQLTWDYTCCSNAYAGNFSGTIAPDGNSITGVAHDVNGGIPRTYTCTLTRATPTPTETISIPTDTPTPTDTPSVDLTGIWTVSTQYGAYYVLLSQSGQALSGTYNVGGESGTVDGSVSGAEVGFTLTQTTGGAAGYWATFTGSVTDSGAGMGGTVIDKNGVVAGWWAVRS